MSKFITMFHANCFDGMTAAAIIYKEMNEHSTADLEFIPVNYGDITPENIDDWRSRVDGCYLGIVDFSVPRDMLHKLAASSITVSWIDHHKGAFDDYEYNINEEIHTQYDNISVHLDNARCGARIVWENLHPYRKSLLVTLIDDGDRWVNAHLDQTRPLRMALAPMLADQTEAGIAKWAELLDDDDKVLALIEQGKPMVSAYDAELDKLFEQVLPCSINQHLGLAVNAPRKYISEIGHRMAERTGTYGFVFSIGVTKDGKPTVYCSLRSVGDFDVNAMAKLFGGGGHKNAAGFECSMDTLQIILDGNF